MIDSEDELIRRFFAPLAGAEGLGLTDDAALMPSPIGADWVVTTDMICEGVHFLDDPPDTIAAKALRVNLSDLAAKGAKPLGYTLALALSRRHDEVWLGRFAAGLAADQERYGLSLIGGDTTLVDGPATITITALGTVPAGTLVRRSGAKPGDAVLVSGTIGDAALGLLVRTGELAPVLAESAVHLQQRYLLPNPRTALAPVLRKFATAAMDISDGLAGDLAKLCAASGAAAEIEIARVPLSDAARSAMSDDSTLMESILTGGDDYEILATVPPGLVAETVAMAAREGVAMAVVGRMFAGSGQPSFRDPNGGEAVFRRRSFDHFSRSAGL